MKTKVSIIILTWNGIDYTKMCLKSLKENTNYENYEIVVVDNGSSDGTIEYLRQMDGITLIENSENLGFVKGNNVALRNIIEGDIVLLNNDIIIEQDNWLDKLNETAYLNSDIGIVGCRLKNEKNEFLHAGTYIYPETYWGQQIGGGQKDVGQYPYNREVQGIVFACAYIKRDLLNVLPRLNEAFFSYFEDTDYCLAAKEKGFKCICCGEVTLIHYQNVSTSINKVSFNDMFRKSQKTFKAIWESKLTQRYKMGVSWNSIVNFPSGYAVSAKNMMLSLDKKNVDVRYKYVYGKGTPYPVDEPELSDNYIINVIRKRKFDESLPQIVYGQGDVFEKNSGKYKIGFTMLETTGIPQEWVRQANMMDEVWVPSKFNVETFRNSGVIVPIHIIPLGVDCDFFNPLVKNYKKHNKYTFLSIFEWGERKAPEVLLKAYNKAFNKKDDVLLICKVINNDPSIDINNELAKMNLSKNGAPIVFLYNQKVPDYQMPTLYTSADCFVLPTRGEGWGMPVLEAMACGLPTITTGWSAQTEFHNNNLGYVLNTKRLVDAKAKCPYYKGFQWADPDEEHLVELMRYVYNNQQEARNKGMKAALDVAQKWTWSNTAEKILNRLQVINNG